MKTTKKIFRLIATVVILCGVLVIADLWLEIPFYIQVGIGSTGLTGCIILWILLRKDKDILK